MNPPPFARSAHLLKISARPPDINLGLASVRDFTVSFEDCVVPTYEMDRSIPYCCDIESERLWYTIVERPEEILAAPFLYQAQRKHAVGILSIPWELLPVREQLRTQQPMFVFSVGRCGSTLLAALLKACGQPSVSEPDFLTQLAVLKPAERRRLGSRAIRTLAAAGSASLARQCGRQCVVKLRHHCNTFWPELIAAVPDCRLVFMLRDRVSWARSRHRAFGDGPEVIARLLREGLEALDRMVRAGARPQVLWYDQLIGDPAGVLKSLSVDSGSLRLPEDPQALQDVLARDSQEGTGIGQSQLRERPTERACLKAFDSLWRQLEPRELIARLGLEKLS